MEKNYKFVGLCRRLSFATALFAASSLLCVDATARTLREEIADNPAASLSYFTPYTFDGTAETPAPDGYEPFYVSHYGRHGSRWMTKDSEYTGVADVFARADSLGLLTPEGRDVYARLKALVDDGMGRYGGLSPLGAEQHRGIGSRLASRYPSLFADTAHIDARSSIVVRCVNSMAAFSEGMREVSPKLKVSRSADIRTSRPLAFFNRSVVSLDPEYTNFTVDGIFIDECASILADNMDVDAIVGSLFSLSVLPTDKERQKFLVWLFYIGADSQCVGLGDINFYDVFSPTDLYWLNVYDNYRVYSKYGPNPKNGGWPMYMARPLLEDILARADSALAGNGPAADLRFGHDVSISALYPLMRIGEYAPLDETDPVRIGNLYQVRNITPMAANLQMVFYRNPEWPGEVLVKFFHNEKETTVPVSTDIAPYYRWKDVESYYRDILDSMPLPSTPVSCEK